MKKSNSIFLITVSLNLFLLTACSSTFRTMNVKQPILLSTEIITVDGKKIPADTKNNGEVSGMVLYSHTQSYGSSTTEEKANADIDFMGCVKTDADRFVTGLKIKAINYQYWFGAGGKSEIDFWGNCHQLPSSE
jgi:hypothetical protein